MIYNNKTGFEIFLDEVVRLKKRTYLAKRVRFDKGAEESKPKSKAKPGAGVRAKVQRKPPEAKVKPTIEDTSGRTQPEFVSNRDFADSQLDDNRTQEIRKTQDFTPYGKAAPSGDRVDIHKYLKPKEGYSAERAGRKGEKDHLMAILNNAQYFFGARVSKDNQAKVSDITGLDDKQMAEINHADHGLNSTQLHALLYMDSHGTLKDAPPVISDRYQQERYLSMMRDEILAKQSLSGKPRIGEDGKQMTDREGNPLFHPKWELSKSSLTGIHVRVRKSLLPLLSGKDDRYTSDKKYNPSAKETNNEKNDTSPAIRRNAIEGAAKFVGLQVNKQQQDGSNGPMVPEGNTDKDGVWNDNLPSNDQLLELDRHLNTKGGYSPTHNASFTRMWHGIMKQEVYDMIDGTTLGMKDGKPYDASTHEALYHKAGPIGVIEKLYQMKMEDPNTTPQDKKDAAEVRMKTLVALGLTFATDHVAQSLAMEGQGRTVAGGDKEGKRGFVVLPSGEWKEYADQAEKDKIFSENPALHDSGALWYDDDMAQTDSSLVNILNAMNKGNENWEEIPQIKTTVPPTDKEGGKQHDALTCLKAIIAPTSFGMQPGANLRVAMKVYTQAKEKYDSLSTEERNKTNVFAFIETKQDDSLDPDASTHLQHENRIYGRAKAVSNSMEILDPVLFASINKIYQGGDPAEIKKAIYLQKEWLRLEEYRGILIQKEEGAKLRPPKKKTDSQDQELDENGKIKSTLKDVFIRLNHQSTDDITKIRNAAKGIADFKIPEKIKEDDLDITVKGAFKKPNLSALARNSKNGDNQSKMNTWAKVDGGGTYSEEFRKKHMGNLKDMQFNTDDLSKDWTTRGGSINPMLRFIKNYATAFGKNGEAQLASFLHGSHSAQFMAQEFVKYSLPTNTDGLNSFQVEIQEIRDKSTLSPEEKTKAINEIKEDYEKLVTKNQNKFIQAAPAGLREDIKNGKMGVSGSYIFGPKGGNFHQDLSYNGGYPTKDLWYTRWMLWGLGTQTNSRGHLIDTPPASLAGVFDLINDYTAQEFGLTNKQVQAIGWYHWKNFCTRMGVRTSGMENYTSAARELYESHATKNKYTPEAMPEINRKGANENAKGNPNAVDGNGVPLPISEANRGRAHAVNGYSIREFDKNANGMDGKVGRFSQKKQGAGGGRLPGRGHGVVRLAQFKPAPGGMTGTPVATRTNQPFSNAVAKSPGGKNLAQGALGNQINAKAGIQTTAQNAVGDWPNGSEESIVHTAPLGTDLNKLKYLAAWHGISGQKKSVLVFHPNDKGPDSLYHIDHPSTDMGEVREQLTNAGIGHKTLLPGAKGTKVIIYDPMRTQRNSIDQFATLNNLNVTENIGQGEIVGHNGDWNSAGALPKSRQAYQNIIGEYEQNSNQAGPPNNTSGAPPNAAGPSAGQAQQLAKKATATKARIKFDKSRRVLEGFLRQHNTPNKELPHVGELLQQDLHRIKPEHLTKYQQLVPDAKWSDIEGAVTSLHNDPDLYDDMTSESNRRSMYCKEHARSVLHSSGLRKMMDSLQVSGAIPEHARHMIEDAKDGDFHALHAISAELKHSVPALKDFAKSAEREHTKAGKAWDKMRSGPQPQKFAKKSAHAKDQYRAGVHGVNYRGTQYNGGQFAPQNDGVKRFAKDSNLTHMIKKLRGA